MSDNKSKFNEEAPKNTMGGNAVKTSAWRKLMAKKWAAPSAFLAAAAIIVTIMWLNGGAGETDKPTSASIDATTQGVTEEQVTEEQATAGEQMIERSQDEAMNWPADNSKLNVVAQFYDASASNEDRMAALIEAPNNQMIANRGIDLANKDNKAFNARPWRKYSNINL